MLLDYRKMVDDHPLTVHESSRGYQLFTERHLQAMWLEQRYFTNLKTTTGAFVEVVSPGIWNAEAGPDFLKAHLCIDGQDVKGDIELHLSDDGWEQHGHHTDPRYRHVVLHLALWKPRALKTLATLDGTSLACAHFEECLTVPLGRLVQLIDLDLYPYRKFVGSGRCAQTVFRTLSTTKTEELFSSAALWRLELKQRFLQARCATVNEQLLAGFAMALGYKANAQSFIEIFLQLRAVNQSSLHEAPLAVALGMAGFFAERYSEKWQGSQHYQSLLRVWMDWEHRISARFPVVVLKQRPFNHPVRRLAALTLLAQDAGQESLFDDCERRWASEWRVCVQKQRWNSIKQALLQRMPSYDDSYWSRHYLFEMHGKADKLVLVGPEIKQAVLLNAFLPLLHARIVARKNEQELGAFVAFYASLTASGSGKLRYLTHRFFGETPKGELLKSAMIAQGAFQVHRDFCIHYEASCEGCPFIDRVKNTHGFLRSIVDGASTLWSAPST